ncbi:MAG TPA: JAB domain-containing protein, partial [Candidatus Methanoperedenaceae archaeon]|nr:JAB domain-containing protein [Candidatus Methanoperedenaceae archaeon]
MEDREELISSLAASRIYPVCSPKGRIFLRGQAKLQFSDEQAAEIINRLDLRTVDDCRKVREHILKRISESRTTMPIRQWVEDERPREMLVKQGASALSPSKLFAIILRTGSDGRSAEELGKDVLNKFKTLRGIDSAEIAELCTIRGIGMAKAAQLKAALELGKRLCREDAEQKKKIRSAEDVISYVTGFYSAQLRDAKKEFFYVILLDNRNKVINNVEISRGSLTASIVDPKIIIKEATSRLASSIILVHNHPSGEPEPSRDDVATTKQVSDACALVGIKVLDHVIIGMNKGDYTS